jgi:hypothetical protein
VNGRPAGGISPTMFVGLLALIVFQAINLGLTVAILVRLESRP